MRLFILITIFYQCQFLFAQKQDQLIPYRSGDKWGYCNSKKEIIIKPVYERLTPFSNGVAQVYIKREWALINDSNKILVPFAQQRLAEVKKDVFIKAFKKDTGYVVGLINTENKTLLPFEYDYIRPVNGVLELKKQGKYGVETYEGIVLIQPVYDNITFLENDLCVLSKDNLRALYNLKGGQLTELKYMVIDDYRNNLSKVRLKDLFGFIDKQGKELIPPVYEMVFPFSQGYAVVQSGKIVIPPKFDYMGDIHRGVAAVKKGSKWALIYNTGKELARAEFDEIKRIYNGSIAVKKNNKWAIMNAKGEVLTPFEYDEIKIRENEENSVRDFGRKELINDPGYLLISKDKKWGVADIDGKIVIKTEFDDIYPFTNNTALIAKNKKWALIDSKGNIKTEFIYDKLEPFIAGVENMKDHGIILFQREGKWGMLNLQGKEITAPLYDYIRPADDNYYGFFKDKRMGVLDSTGKEIIQAKYEKVRMQPVPNTFDKFIFINDLCLVLTNGKPGYVSKEGIEYFD